MPTNLDRIQVLLNPDVFALVATLASDSNLSHSAMCAQLIKFALKSDYYKERLENIAVHLAAKDDPRKKIQQVQHRLTKLSDKQMNKLMKLIDIAESL